MSDHDQAIRIVGVCGSTREGSYNRTLLHTAASLFPEQIGLMKRRFASINDMPISESERKFHWPLGRRPDNHPGLTDLGL